MKIAVRLIVLLLIAAGLTAGYFVFGDGLISRYHVWQAERAESVGNYATAVSHYERALARLPQSPAVRLEAVRLLKAQGFYPQAERLLLAGLEVQAGEPTMLTALSALFVLQNNLRDAIELLDAQDGLAGRINDLRPRMPVPDPEPGQFGEHVYVTFDTDDGVKIFYTLDGSMPSVNSEPFDTPIALPVGENVLTAVAVGEDGLVSRLFEGTYRLEGLVKPVAFVDEAIEALVRDALGQPTGELFTSDLWDIVGLNNEALRVMPTTLEDLQWLTGLRELLLLGGSTPLDGLDVLAQLPTLQHLTLENAHVTTSDLDTLAQMDWLRQLDLSNNRITSIEALHDMQLLFSLNLSGNNISDISPLANLAQLEILMLSDNAVNDLSPLEYFEQLHVLRLDDNQITSLTPLANLDLLKNLSVRNNAIASVAPLTNIRSLQILNVSNNNITTLAPLLNCPALRKVDAADNPLRDAVDAFDDARFELQR
ncbi:MAG: leucine-rich repeat domain-containing protein [Oscillospiraceae bacterium]|nr:leucine-rich repeat domain-containing protein [Oscillospiraceae bacterium]